jgi:hypothetical protein
MAMETMAHEKRGFTHGNGDFPVRYVTNDQRVPYFPHSHVAEESLHILLRSS